MFPLEKLLTLVRRVGPFLLQAYYATALVATATLRLRKLLFYARIENWHAAQME